MCAANVRARVSGFEPKSAAGDFELNLQGGTIYWP